MNIARTADGEVTDQARRIVEVGKLIHEHVHKTFNQHITGSRGKKRLADLTMPQLEAVKAARQHGGVTITELSRVLGVSAPSASAMVDRLVDRGILRRERSRHDRRKVAVRVSEDVAEDIRHIEEKILGAFVEIIEKLGPETTEKWCEVLVQVKRILDETPPSDASYQI